MKITFLGVGSAFDEKHTNTSMLFEFNESKMLLDCGYNAPPALWKHNDDPNYLDAIWISHLHGDHYFGLSPLIIRMVADKRTKPLYILTAKGNKQFIEHIIDMGYKGTIKKAKFELKIIEFEKQADFAGLTITIAPTIHPVFNNTARFEYEDKALVYSGDGMFTAESKDLFYEADLLIHEAYTIAKEVTGHTDIKSLLEVLNETKVKKLALVHIYREVRDDKQKILDYVKGRGVVVPEENDVIEF